MSATEFQDNEDDALSDNELYLAAREERLQSYCEDVIFNDGCDLDDEDAFGEKELMLRGQAMIYAGWCVIAFLAIGIALESSHEP